MSIFSAANATNNTTKRKGLRDEQRMRLCLQLSGYAVVAGVLGVKVGDMQIAGEGGYLSIGYCSDFELKEILMGGSIAPNFPSPITDSLACHVERLPDGGFRLLVGSVESIGATINDGGKIAA